ncbi:unnamed protein product [Cuscuta campestris]|uniref:CCHC-type domain-containing protein n=1 Tax=Cuscuta campestris TaxID=132261 RepID=A0A484MWE6_9ASTE|nr:unnamed protein product [Cuscuta campestris]
MPNSDGKFYPSLLKPWCKINTRQNDLAQGWETYTIDGNPAMRVGDGGEIGPGLGFGLAISRTAACGSGRRSVVRPLGEGLGADHPKLRGLGERANSGGYLEPFKDVHHQEWVWEDVIVVGRRGDRHVDHDKLRPIDRRRVHDRVEELEILAGHYRVPVLPGLDDPGHDVEEETALGGCEVNGGARRMADEFGDVEYKNFGYSPYQDPDGVDYYEPHGDQDDYDQSGPMYDNQPDPLVEEIIKLEQKIFYFDELLFVEGSWYEPPYSRDYTLFAEEQIEANKVAIRERAKLLESVRKEKEFERRLCEGSEMMQKMLDDFQRERLEAESKDDKLVNDLCMAVELKRSLQSQDQMREINKPESITTLARATVVMLPEYPSSQVLTSIVVHEVEPTEGPDSEPPTLIQEKEEEVLPTAINDHLLNCVEDTPPEKPVLEEVEPITCPQDTNVQVSEQESIDEELFCMEKPTPLIETCVHNTSSKDSDQTFFDSLLDGCDYVCPNDGWSQKSWDELLVSDTEDSSMGESTVVIIKPQMDGQPVEDKEKINLAMKVNDVDLLRRLPPPPTYLESPPFILLPPSRRDESRILDLDRATNQTRWHQKRVRRAKVYDSRIGKSRKKWILFRFYGIESSEKDLLEAETLFVSDPSPDNLSSLNLMKAKHNRCVKNIDSFWRQKANINWIKQGEANTSFFHNFVKGKRKKLLIHHIMKEEDNILNTQKEIMEDGLSFFKQAFCEESIIHDSDLLHSIPTVITDDDNILLTRLPNEEEVKEAIFSLNPNSCAGWDGFNGLFFQTCWEIVKEDVVSSCQEYFLGIPPPKSMCKTMISLIPKTSSQLSLKTLSMQSSGLRTSFKMLPGESFDMLDERFHKILNDLASLNHILSPKEKNVRLLRSLPTEWYTKATAMEEGRNLENYTVQGLLDELRTYEHELKKRKEEQVTPFPTALMTTPRIPSSEGTCTRNCDTPSSSQPSSSKMENYDEEFAMMVKQFRKFKKFFKKADSIRRPSKGKPQVSDSPPESYLCYNCRKPGHWKSACPYPKVEKYGERERNEKKKKAMVAVESDESSSSSSDEEALVCMERRAEKSNHEDRWTMSEDDTLCLMAKDDADQEVTSQTSCSSSYSIPTSENLFDQFKKMMEDFEEINFKHSSLTEENKLLSEENLKLTEGRKSQLDEITQLKAENESLSEMVKSLNKELGILKSKEAVDRLLETTKHKGREGLGFDPSSSKRKGRTTFIPPKPTAKPNKQKRKENEKPTEVPKKFCDKGYSLEFCKDMASLKNISTNKVILTGKRIRNIYEVMWDDVKEACLISKGDTNLLWLWHKRLSHLNFKTLNKLSKEGLVEGLPKAVFRKESICDACQKRKLVKSTFKAKLPPSTTMILSLIHMDLFAPVTPISLSGKKYVLVVVDDYSRYMWTIFLNSKKETQGKLTNCMKLIQNQASQTIQKIRSDKGTEFLNEIIIHYCEENEILHQTSAARTPQQNGVAERRNRTLKEADEEVNEGDRMKPTEFIPFRSLPLKTSQRNPDSDSAEPSGNLGQPSNIPDHSNGDNSGNGDLVPIHPETPTTSVLQPEAELDQPVNPNQHNLRWLRNHPPRQVIGDIQSSVVDANVHFQKLEAKCSSPAFYQCYLEMIAAQELSEFLQMEICLKFKEVLEFYKNGEVKTAHSKKDPQRTFQVIKSIVGGRKVKLSQKNLGEKLHLPNSGVEIGRFPVKNLDWNIIGISRQAPSGQAKKADLNNDYKLVLELVIACLECGSGGHADDITQERAFIINALITKSKVNWAAHFFKSISKHLGKHNQKYLCQGLYIGHILESMGAASEGKKYEERYWLYYLSSKGENRAGASATVEESLSNNVPLINLTKTAKRKQVMSFSLSVEAPQNLVPVNLEEAEEVSVHGELQRKKKRKITSPSTSGYVNPDELKEKEPAVETSAHKQSPQQLEEEAHQVHSLPTPSPQPQTDDAENQFWQLYYNWRAWKVGNSAEQLLDWDQQLKNEKIIKKCIGLPVNHSCEEILDDYWVWQRNHEDLHLEHLATTPILEFEVDDEDPTVYKPVLSKTTEDQVVLTSEAQANLEATAEDFQIFPETSSTFETVLPEAIVSTPKKQNQEGSDEELHQHLQSQVLEILTTACEISNQPELEIPEKSGENLDQSTFLEATEAQEEQAVEAQRSSAEAEIETQMAELEASKSPVAIFEVQNEAEERDSLSRYISNFALDEAEGESERTLKSTDEDDVQEDAESLPMQLFQRTPSSHQVTYFHFHSSSIPTLPDEVLETWTKKVQGLIESALASQHAFFRQEIEQMEARYNKLIEKSEETHCSNLKEISKSVDKTLEIISLLSKTVSHTMETYASDSYLQLKEVNKIREQIANVTVSLQKQMSLLQMDIRSALAVSSANQVITKDYLKVIIDNQKEAFKLFRLLTTNSGNCKMEVVLQQHSPSLIPELPIAVKEGEVSYIPTHLNMTDLILEAQRKNP